MSLDDAQACGKSADEVIDHIVRFAKRSKLGKYDGRSSGSGGFDVSFQVANRAEAAASLRAEMKERFPAIRYSLSDEYEAPFDDRPPTPDLAEQLESLEQIAGMMIGMLAALRSELEARGVITRPHGKRGRR